MKKSVCKSQANQSKSQVNPCIKHVRSCKCPANLPISKKAYFGFIDRINAIFSSDAAAASLMRGALDRYLSGDSDAGESLPAPLRFAFAFLCQNVDCAIRRSECARSRAISRKNKSMTAIPSTPEAAEVSPTQTPVNHNEEASQAATAFQRPLTRQQRRAQARAARREAARTAY